MQLLLKLRSHISPKCRNLPIFVNRGQRIRKELAFGAKKAVEKVARLRFLKYETSLRIEPELIDSTMGEVVVLLPFVKRRSVREVSFATKGFPILYRILMALIALCLITKKRR